MRRICVERLYVGLCVSTSFTTGFVLLSVCDNKKKMNFMPVGMKRPWIKVGMSKEELTGDINERDKRIYLHST